MDAVAARHRGSRASDAAGTSTHIVIVSANPAPDLLSRADVHNITVIDKSRPIGTVIQSCHATLVDDGRAEEAG